MEVLKFVALSLGGALISTGILALIARPLASAIRHLIYPHLEPATRTQTLSDPR
jgi:hypothetical protein